MKLGQYNNWIEETNRCTGDLKDSHVVAEVLPADYADISTIENWDKYGRNLIGSAFGFKDWKCLSREIRQLVEEKTDNDLDANWNDLNAAEKMIACNYMLSKVPGVKLAALVPDAEQRMNIAISFDVNNREARGSWLKATGRVQMLRIFLFSKIGSENALKTFYDVVKEGLLELYEGGIVGTMEDGNQGINDFLLARNGTAYSANGFTERNYPVTDGSGDTLEDVALAMVNITNYGLY
ncbi:MAG: hypothetical protein M3R17_21375 [Bacteroidota bacterium]|nr:hypothetical protein [Bacteroidota bacterium]